MYQHLIKPILFTLHIDEAHRLVILLLRLIGWMPLGRWLLKKCYTVHHPALEREVFGVHFDNPIGMAAGFDCNGEIYRELSAMGFGFVEIGTITPQAQSGNPQPRVFRLCHDRSIINRTGYPNKGLQRAIQNLRRPHKGMIVGCNIGRNITTPAELAPKDYLKVFRNLYQYADYFAVNICCDNTCRKGSSHTSDEILNILEPLFDFRRGQNQYRPIMLKISPDLSDREIEDIIEILISTPLDGIVATNGSNKRTGLSTSKATLDQIGSGRMSGQTLTQRSIEIVRLIHQRTHGTYPIIGVGGMMSVDNVRAMLHAGADLVQLYSGYIYNGPQFVREICTALIQDYEIKQARHEAHQQNELFKHATEEAVREAEALDLAEDIAAKQAEVAVKTKGQNRIRDLFRPRRK